MAGLRLGPAGPDIVAPAVATQRHGRTRCIRQQREHPRTIRKPRSARDQDGPACLHEIGFNFIVLGTVTRAISLIAANLGSRIRIADLVAVSGCSVRTLFAQFRSRIGSSPMYSLRAARLRRVRDDLQCGAPAQRDGSRAALGRNASRPTRAGWRPTTQRQTDGITSAAAGPAAAAAASPAPPDRPARSRRCRCTPRPTGRCR